MASQAYLPGLVYLPEQGMYRPTKGFQPLFSSLESRQDMMRLGSLGMRPHPSGQWKPTSGLLHGDQIDRTIRRPLLIDVQDTGPNSILFSFGIAKQCIRRWEILKFLMYGSNEVERDIEDLSKLSELVGLQEITSDMPQEPHGPEFGLCFRDAESRPTLFYPNSDFYSQKPLLDFMGDLAHRSQVMVHPDGRVLLTGSGTEMKDILSIAAKFYSSENTSKWRKKPVLVPHFDRLRYSAPRSNIRGSSLKLQTVKFAPVKSTEKIKLKPSPKRKSNRKAGKERDIYRKNHSHAFECLLSIMVDKKRNGKATVLALKKCGPELPQLLIQVSASIAGTGLALLFSLACNVAIGGVPFCASKVLNTGFGLGLVWLSWAVHKLRESVIYISKSSGKFDVKEEETLKNLDKSVKEIYFRVATVMAVAALRLA